MTYPNIGLLAPITGILVGLGIAGFLVTIFFGLRILYHGLRSDLSTAWATYGAKTKKVLILFLIGLAGTAAAHAYRWIVFGF